MAVGWSQNHCSVDPFPGTGYHKDISSNWDNAESAAITAVSTTTFTP